MKKKLLTLVLALTMVLSMSMTAMAAENQNFKKVYTGDKYVAETLSFTVTPSVSNGEGAPELKVNNGANVVISTPTTEIPLSVDLTQEGVAPGKYTYTITENDGTTQGVKYGVNGDATNKEITVEVLVSYDATNNLTAEIGATKDGENKKDTIYNTYETGTLTVTKATKGNMLNKNTEFSIDVTFKAEDGKTVIGDIKYVVNGNEENVQTITAAEVNAENGKTVTISLADAKSAVFSDIPFGVTYSVVEEAGDYTTAYSGTDITSTESVVLGQGNEDVVTVKNASEEALTNGSLSETNETVTITNYKSEKVDTGIIVNNLPYILVLAGVAVAAVVVIRKKRYSAM